MDLRDAARLAVSELYLRGEKGEVLDPELVYDLVFRHMPPETTWAEAMNAMSFALTEQGYPELSSLPEEPGFLVKAGENTQGRMALAGIAVGLLITAIAVYVLTVL